MQFSIFLQSFYHTKCAIARKGADLQYSKWFMDNAKYFQKFALKPAAHHVSQWMRGFCFPSHLFEQAITWRCILLCVRLNKRVYQFHLKLFRTLWFHHSGS